MKKINEPDAIIRYRGELVRVVGISHGKVIYMEPIEVKHCEYCGEIKQYAVLEESPNFQDGAEKIATLES